MLLAGGGQRAELLLQSDASPCSPDLSRAGITMTQQESEPRWSTVAIFAVGLIGGSIGLALRKRGLAKKVVGIGRSAERLAQAVDLGAIDEFVTNISDLPEPEITVLCAPVQLLPEHCRQIFRACPNSLITDAGSTKRSLVAEVEKQIPAARFVGSHPLAGSDKSGVAFAKADLYEDRVVVLTPTDHTNKTDLVQVKTFWETLGARTVSMDPTTHDQALAITSHVPHILASSLAAETDAEFGDLIAGGWRDTTRIAAADVELWTQILQENRMNVLDSLRQVREKLEQYEQALTDDNRDSLMRLLAAGKQQRDALGS